MEPITKMERDEKNCPEVLGVPVEPVLDLHTYDPRELKPLLDDYLSEAQAQGFETVRIIHGKGRGVLRRRVRALLSRHPLVFAFYDASPASGSWGATVVHLSSRKGGQENVVTLNTVNTKPNLAPPLRLKHLGIGLLLGILIGAILLWMTH